MVVEPCAMPVTPPVKEPTVPMAVLLLLHVPPVLASLSVVVEATHTFVLPVIATGNGLTVSI